MAEVAQKAKSSIGDIVYKIDSMSPKEKQSFCQTLTSDEKSQYLKYLKARDSEEVEVIFKSFEPVGGMVKFTAIPYEGVGGTYEFFDGIRYKIPICLAKRFNNEFQGAGTFYPTNAYILDASGKPVFNTGKKNYRFAASSPSLM